MFPIFSHNPKFNDREGIELEEIPFVQEILAVKYESTLNVLEKARNTILVCAD